MAERKAGVDFETWIERQIRTAQERGEFDDLPGMGKPLPGLNQPHDELWWIKQKALSEGWSTEAMLPTPLQLRKEVERLPETVGDLRSEQAVRDLVSDLNLRIAHWMREPSGPQVPIGPVNTENLVAQWRAQRSPVASDVADAPEETAEQVPPRRRARWWHRLTRRRGSGD